MKLKTLAIRAPRLFSISIFFRRSLEAAIAIHLILLLLYTLFHSAAAQTSLLNGVQNRAEYDACQSQSYDPSTVFQDIIVDDTSSNYVAQTLLARQGIESICTNSHSFCFLSPLLGSVSTDHELKPTALETSESQLDAVFPLGSANLSRTWSNTRWPSNSGVFELLNGRKVSCSLSHEERSLFTSSTQTVNDNPEAISSCNSFSTDKKDANVQMGKKAGMTKSNSFNVFSPFSVEISPPVLDWGERFLFFPSVRFLKVANKCNSSSSLHIYEPFSSNKQFYPCNHSDILLLPGEVASICFVFLPRWLGLSSAELVLQTNVGGFVVKAKGVAVESPYGIQPLVSIDFPFNLWSRRNFSLFNPLHETFSVKEVMVWVSVSSGNSSHQMAVNCLVENFQDSHEVRFLGTKDWLVLQSRNDGYQSMATRPHNNWEIGPRSKENIMEMEFSLQSEGKVSGAVCMELLRSSQKQPDIILVPFEVDLHKKADGDNFIPPVSFSVEPLILYDSDEMVVAISLKSDAPYMLSVVNITETSGTKNFHVKYTEGLLLFPGTVTSVALATRVQPPTEIRDPSAEIAKADSSCVLRILTNDSSNPQVEIPCQDIFRIFSNGKESPARFRHQYKHIKSGDEKTGCLASGMRSSLQSKALGGAEADELILGNWKSQGTKSGLFVLKEQEVVFPVVEVGGHGSKHITVKNPSHQPVVMQLILNPGEIISDCRDQDGLRKLSSLGTSVHGEHIRPEKHGFSILGNAVTEAHIQAYGKASFGPINFHPLDRCRWRSSALIRNNLSGVEWLSLTGSGGLFSLTLLENSKPVQTLEFIFTLPKSVDVSPLSTLFHMEKISSACSQPLSKELYAKNTGDLPLEVKRIMVSGRDCGVDGFVVNHCSRFSLEPGEARKFLITYQTDFSVPVLHRDLELVLASGILATPVKATAPVHSLNLCKKSAFLLRVKRISIVLIAALVFLVLFCIFSQAITAGSQNCFYEREESFSAKPSYTQFSKRRSRLSVCGGMNCLLKPVGGDKVFIRASLENYPCGQDEASEVGIASENAVQNLQSQGGTNSYARKSGPANLIVKTGKEKRRNRKKRKGTVAELTGTNEVSSSQSGNSTPTSPLSPLRPPTPSHRNSPDSDQSGDSENLFARLAEQHYTRVQTSRLASMKNMKERNATVKRGSNTHSASTQRQPLRPALTHSVTFPFSSSRPGSSIRCSSPLAYTSLISPHARAPGSRICDGETGKSEERRRGKEYVYDIWGSNHLSGLRLMERLKEDLGGRETSFTEDESYSLFVKGPLSFLANSQPRYVSFFNQEEQ